LQGRQVKTIHLKDKRKIQTGHNPSKLTTNSTINGTQASSPKPSPRKHGSKPGKTWQKLSSRTGRRKNNRLIRKRSNFLPDKVRKLVLDPPKLFHKMTPKNLLFLRPGHTWKTISSNNPTNFTTLTSGPTTTKNRVDLPKIITVTQSIL
jgi:hypothetical protein